MQPSFVDVRPDTENDKLISALAYVIIPLVSIIILVSDMKRSRFNRIHAYQGLVFFGVAVLYYIVYGIFFTIVTGVIGLLACVLWVGYFIPVAVAIYLAFRVFTKGQVEFPYLTQATSSVFKDM